MSTQGAMCDVRLSRSRPLAEFWATVLSYDVDVRHETFGEAEIIDPEGIGLGIMFLEVPEGKIVKNRMHVDLLAETPFEAEVERLVAAGARALETHQDPDGYEGRIFWTVMQDPEGNEFCVGEPMSRRRDPRHPLHADARRGLHRVPGRRGRPSTSSGSSSGSGTWTRSGSTRDTPSGFGAWRRFRG